MRSSTPPATPARRRRGEAGVTMVEYALAAGIAVVACLIGLQSLQANAEDRLERDAALGAPDLPDGGLPATTQPTTPPTTPEEPPTTPPANVVASSTIVSQSNGRHGNSWSPTVTIRVVDSAGDPITNAVVTVRWDLATPATINPTPCSVTAAQGRCTFQLPDLEARPGKTGFVAGVTFTVVSITGTNPTLTYAPAAPLTTTLAP